MQLINHLHTFDRPQLIHPSYLAGNNRIIRKINFFFFFWITARKILLNNSLQITLAIPCMTEQFQCIRTSWMMLKGNPIQIVAVKSHLASQELELSMLLLLQKCTNM